MGRLKMSSPPGMASLGDGLVVVEPVVRGDRVVGEDAIVWEHRRDLLYLTPPSRVVKPCSGESITLERTLISHADCMNKEEAQGR